MIGYKWGMLDGSILKGDRTFNWLFHIHDGVNVSTNVVWFFLIKRTFNLSFDSLKTIGSFQSVSLNLVFLISKLTHFFKFKNLQNIYYQIKTIVYISM